MSAGGIDGTRFRPAIDPTSGDLTQWRSHAVAISCSCDVAAIVLWPVRLRRRLLRHQPKARDEPSIGEGVDRSPLVPIELQRPVGEQHHDDTVTTRGCLPHQARITVDEHARNVSRGYDRNESRLAVCGMRLARHRRLRWCDSPASAYRIGHTACSSQSVSCLLEEGIQAMSGGNTTSSVQSTAIRALLNSDGTWSR